MGKMGFQSSVRTGLAASAIRCGLLSIWLLTVSALAEDSIAPPPMLTRGTRVLNPATTVPPGPPDARTAPDPAFAPVPEFNGTMGLIPGPPIRVATLDGQSVRLSGLLPVESAFEIVPLNQHPDLVWDPSSREIIATGDKIATGIEMTDIPSVVDRMAAVRTIRQMAVGSPLLTRLLPDTKMHSLATRVEISVDDVGGKALLMLNISGDGTVQVLYPAASTDLPIYDKPQFRMEFNVQEPFGADQFIAITSPQRNIDLERELKRLDNQRKSGQVAKILTRFGLPGMRYGLVSLFTGP